MQIVVFHYHLLPGGVTDVILHSLRATLGHRTDVTEVILVTGQEENAEKVAGQLADTACQVRVDVVRDLAYTDQSEPITTALDRADRLQSTLMERYATEDALWWVHNHHVGKNPSFTLALCRISDLNSCPRILLHIHDFPECARFENLSFLNRIAGESPYPAGPAVRYAVINSRDHEALVESGIPATRVHLLADPVPPSEELPKNLVTRKDLADRLTRFADANGQKFDPARRILLYPIRTIRRKNVLEMAVIAQLAENANLITTLPGLSAAESGYSDLVREAYATGAARGVFGIGRRETEVDLSFADLTHGSDAVVSSSVQEGFGLLFVNAPRWRVPLFARYLDVLDGIVPVFQGYPALFYNQLRVPMTTPGVTSVRVYLRMRYAERLDAMGGALPESARDRLDSQLSFALAQPTIDFGLLPPDIQFAYLNSLADEAFCEEIRGMNTHLFEDLGKAVSADCPDISARVDDTFGYAAFAGKLDRVMGSFEQNTTGSGRYEETQANLVESFADLENHRLLFAPMGYHHD